MEAFLQVSPFFFFCVLNNRNGIQGLRLANWAPLELVALQWVKWHKRNLWQIADMGELLGVAHLVMEPMFLHLPEQGACWG